MNLRFLGVGGAFDPEFGSSSALVESGADTLTLIDCGCTTYLDLRRTGMVDRVTHVLITHMHDDHVGSLGSLIYHHYYINGRKLELVYPSALHQPLLTLLGQQHTSGPVAERVELREMDAESSHDSRRIGEMHVDWLETTDRHQKGMPSFAYLLSREGETSPRNNLIVYSGDLGDPDFLFHHLEERGLTGATVFHDVFFPDIRNEVHPSYKDLERHLDRWIIRGYHNNPTKKPPDCQIRLVWEDPEYAPVARTTTSMEAAT